MPRATPNDERQGVPRRRRLPRLGRALHRLGFTPVRHPRPGGDAKVWDWRVDGLRGEAVGHRHLDATSWQGFTGKSLQHGIVIVFLMRVELRNKLLCPFQLVKGLVSFFYLSFCLSVSYGVIGSLTSYRS